MSMAGRAGATVVMVTAALPWLGCGPAGPGKATPAADPATLLRFRADALTRARVWREPATPIAEADLRGRETGTLGFADRIDCVIG